jgi:phosphoribosylaminoimidazole-succinocarboxamide synthase
MDYQQRYLFLLADGSSYKFAERCSMSEETLPGLKLFNRGKVRDIYDLGDKLLLVASDRISAFDVILPTLIPDKGKILTALSVYWFGVMQDIIPHHLLTTNVDEFPAACKPHRAALEGRTMLVKKSLPASFAAILSVRVGRTTSRPELSAGSRYRRG